MQGLAYLLKQQDLRIGAWAIGLLAMGRRGLLLLGVLTPFAASLAAFGYSGATCMSLPAGNWNFFHGNPLSLDVIVMAMATAVLGPGAFSLDARLFGRRRIIIPRWTTSPKL